MLNDTLEVIDIRRAKGGIALSTWHGLFVKGFAGLVVGLDG